PGDAALRIAWNFISEAERPSFGYDELYPPLSVLKRRVHLAIERAEREEKDGGLLFRINAKQVLIDSLAKVFEPNDWKATCSKPNAKKRGQSRKAVDQSPFVKFVLAVEETLPGDVPKLSDHSLEAKIGAIAEGLAVR